MCKMLSKQIFIICKSIPLTGNCTISAKIAFEKQCNFEISCNQYEYIYFTKYAMGFY